MSGRIFNIPKDIGISKSPNASPMIYCVLIVFIFTLPHPNIATIPIFIGIQLAKFLQS